MKSINEYIASLLEHAVVLKIAINDLTIANQAPSTPKVHKVVNEITALIDTKINNINFLLREMYNRGYANNVKDKQFLDRFVANFQSLCRLVDIHKEINKHPMSPLMIEALNERVQCLEHVSHIRDRLCMVDDTASLDIASFYKRIFPETK